MGFLAKLFGKKESPQNSITLQLNDRCGPILRGQMYREPLDTFLQSKKIGEVEGGGSQIKENGEISYCDLELILNADIDSAIEDIKSEIERIEVPKGSLIIIDENRTVPVGNLIGVGIYFKYTEVPEDVINEMDMDAFWDGIEEAIGTKGRYHDFWQGEEQCALYFYGSNEEEIITAVKNKLNGHPFEPFIEPIVQPTSMAN